MRRALVAVLLLSVCVIVCDGRASAPLVRLRCTCNPAWCIMGACMRCNVMYMHRNIVHAAQVFHEQPAACMLSPHNVTRCASPSCTVCRRCAAPHALFSVCARQACLHRTKTARWDEEKVSVRDMSQHMRRKPRAVTLAEIAAENDFKNGLVLWVLPRQMHQAMPRVVQSWVSMQRRGVVALYCSLLCSTVTRHLAAVVMGYHLDAAGAELPHVPGPLRGGRNRLGVVHLRGFRCEAVQGAGAADPPGHGQPSGGEPA